ncbi:MAG: CoA-transferase [Pseudomonadota bacterium]
MSTSFQDKLMTAAQAVDLYVPDGSLVALGGFTVSRNPMLLAREIIRQKKKDLHLAVHSQGQAMDLLIGAGAVKRLEVAYAGTGRFAPTALAFRRAVEKGELEVEDYSNFQMSLRFLAGAVGLPYVPTKSGLETDIIHQEGFSPETRAMSKASAKKLLVEDNPFGPPGDRVVLLPALNPDVALIHAQYVGDGGTVRIKGLGFADAEQARSASRLVVSFEELVPEQWLRQDPDQNLLPGFMVDAFVQAPWGAHPTACHFFYDYDPEHLKLYARAARTPESFHAYYDEWVFEPRDQGDYLDKIGASRLLAIRANPASGYAPGLDRR